ncbi:MAG: HEAT repeat domain-containing protein [Myxococcota bacterium]
MRLVCLTLVVVATLANAQPRVSRCWAACERSFTDPRGRASACAKCLTRPDDVAAWLETADVPLEKLLGDPDWEVRWSALARSAKQAHRTAARELLAWHRTAAPRDREVACATALHAAGALGVPFTKLFDGEGLEGCARLPGVLALELYDEQLAIRQEALEHLAVALEKSPARVVLDVLPTRPAAFDALMVETLVEVQAARGQTAPAALLASAGRGDEKAMNRLLAVFAQQHDGARGRLAEASEPLSRKAAMLELAALAPLSDEPLLAALTDAEQQLRLIALRGLARGEGSSLADAAGRRLSGQKPSTPEQQRAMLELLEATHEPSCAAVAMSAWGTPELRPDVRKLALSTAASCRWDAAAPEVARVLRSVDPGERMAGVAALAWAPHSEQVFEQLRAASSAAEPELRVAACEAMAARRWRGGITSLNRLVLDEQGAVRVAALRALLTLDAEGIEGRLVSRLAADPSPEVRKVAAELLGRLGSPRALGALRDAAKREPDPGVKLVVGQSLRKLGAGSLSP